jgi:cyclic beta-1,2-glucan synthetase
MLYGLILLVVVLILILAYYIFKSRDIKEENIMEDVPVINISREALEKHALDISRHFSDTIVTKRQRMLMKSFDKSFREILKSYEYINRTAAGKREVVPGAEWLLDNLYLIEKEYKDIKHNIPQYYIRNLPVIKKGVMKDYPRIYHIAVELVSHSDGRVDENLIEVFISAYQKNAVLTTGELWALPIMIRIALIQNISKISSRIVFSMEEKSKGDRIADRIIGALNGHHTEDELKNIYSEKIEFTSYFIERLLKALRDNAVDNASVYKWIDENLQQKESNAEKMINMEHQKQAEYQLSIGNCITGIREVDALNWRMNFERLSFVEHILNEDPSGVYGGMDFESRDYYRHMVEKISRKVKAPESFIAKKAIECASDAETESESDYKRHIGYYLIDDGIECLRKKIKCRDTIGSSLIANIRKHKTGYYVGSICFASLLLDIIICILCYGRYGILEDFGFIIGFIAVLIPLSEIVTSLLNWSINHLVEPRFIPKMELVNGIPDEAKTVVVIPTLLGSEMRAHDLIEDMEVYYLANMEKNLYFALLGDFKDSKTEQEENDERIVKAALEDIKILNKKYSRGEDIFYFFSRYRMYNDKQDVWMGFERKRGKLMEFNELLRGSKSTTYNVISGSLEALQDIKYVITLDADTELPRGSAKRLIGSMYHILNRPHYNPDSKLVLRGHGLMQPRISVGILSANKTLFSKIFSGETGIDMYTTAVSDVYEDLFDEGIFTGKGIYDVDLFSAILKDEIPENAVLSHDLLEGSYVRAALLTDVELIDGYPAYYNASAKRLHRWVRGDWQLLPWIFKKSPLTMLSRWKLIDNLRRSLLSPSIIILTALSLSILPNMDKWLVVAFISILFPILFDVSETVVAPAKGISLSGKIENGKMAVEQFLLIFCFLPYMTYLMLDAIVRTLYRLYVSKRKLLEWQTAADVEASSGKEFKNYVKSMWVSSFIAILLEVIAFNRSFSAGFLILPSCIIWFASPYIAYYISRDKIKSKYNLSDSDKLLLRRLSRKTWAYFEDFVNSENNWLAPDNFQEDPPNGVAHRTSPTNMAMSLTSNIAAFDLGFIDLTDVIERTDKIITSMESLERFKGHFLNWYDTKDKHPLHPRYISAVDSGNLIGYLWLTSRTLEDYSKKPVLNRAVLEGICDTLRLADEELEKQLNIKNYYGNLIQDIGKMNFEVITWKRMLVSIWGRAVEADRIKKGSLYWNDKVKHTVMRHLGELQRLLPWTDILMETPDAYAKVYEKLNAIACSIPLCDMMEKINKVQQFVASESEKGSHGEWVEQVVELIAQGRKETESIVLKMENIKNRINDMAAATDFTMLYDKKRQLFSIGYNIERDEKDNCYYDLLASEARQASFIAIAKGDIEQKHWFKLGRAMTIMGNAKGLVSWSGTMFEYFMPLLIMQNYPDTLLNETYEAVIEGQKKYCRERKVPFGISESAFYNFDINKNYQYKAFGVPGIGLKRGLVNELVISPYSTVLALMIDKKEGISNIIRLINEEMEGRYGFYEAVDYTQDRLSKGKKKAIVKCFMVHHEGMSLMSLNNVLNENIFQKRFHSVPRVKAADLLLQEKVPKRIVYNREFQFEASDVSAEKQNIIVRKYTTSKTEIPETHIMSNGNYSIMISNSGSGYGKKGDLMAYRWREDVTDDSKGMFFYIKNLNSGDYWSSTYEPCKKEGDEYEVTFSLDKAEFKRRDGNISTYSEITVSNEDDAEIRRLSITNHSEHTREIEVTSYLEVTLAPYNADLAHPAFGNLFIETEYVDSCKCITASRRPRAKGQETPWLMQTIAVEGEAVGNLQYETNRANFVGRGRTLQDPGVMEEDAPLKNYAGAVLDPIISIRVRVRVAPGKTSRLAYTTAAAGSREEALELALKYREMQNISRTFELAWTQTQVEMKYLGIKSAQANLYQIMASRILYLSPLLRDREGYIKGIRRGQPALWSYGISGDLPIILLKVRESTDIDIARQVLNAHEYIALKGLKVDIVILNEEGTSYMQPLQHAIRDLVSSSHLRDKVNSSGGVFIHSSGSMKLEDVELLMGISRLVIDSKKGSLLSQVVSFSDKTSKAMKLQGIKREFNYAPYKYEVPALEFFNDYGGFEPKSLNYIIRLTNNMNTPAPWINVISNGNFGFHVSESGTSYTWYKNSRENKLTNWSNDPVMEGETEALYIRDEETGSYWSIAPHPVRDAGEYIIEHGFGYSNFTHEKNGILGQMTMFVPVNKSVKVCIVKLKNLTDVERKVSLTYYCRLVLGVVPEITSQYISTGIEVAKDYIYAQNPYSDKFGNLVCFLKCIGGENSTYTGNRKEFLGRGGSMRVPLALEKSHLSGNSGAGFDPCLSMNSALSLRPQEEKNVLILFGEGESKEEVEALMDTLGNVGAATDELSNIKNYWRKTLSTISVSTPDRSMDILLNGWLMYQVISCRIWARTAFYQSGGAYGFRDQLQDVMSAVYLDPEMTRRQILYSASRQFLEGDVQHWWHPVVESGIRTRFSDDLLWLPYVTCDYIECTGDYSILDEMAGYLEDEPLREGEDERYNIARVAEKQGSIYEHCIAALERDLRFGPHNIPLMGSGDWNDGMSTVGNEGRGESVWLGWFLYSILGRFSEICKYKGDVERAEKYEKFKLFISENLEENAWDGSWYRRAYFDDGTPLGSIENDECSIDSISQSWSVISSAARKNRAESAMGAVEQYLIRREKGIVLLLTPAFDKSKLEPGYIKGYVPGVRENGAQYTHAAVWVCLAMAKMGLGGKAWDIFHMINPINHARNYLECETYKVEPYVMAADVYMVPPHEGRGGWTWYTGAAGWMYRTGIEGILGLKLKGKSGFSIEPCVPEEWKDYHITYSSRECIYKIHVVRGDRKGTLLDGNVVENGIIPFIEGGVHSVEVTI